MAALAAAAVVRVMMMAAMAAVLAAGTVAAAEARPRAMTKWVTPGLMKMRMQGHTVAAAASG